jgi:nitroimidazol reductase NimA-like FMN-containing flavoprotein (pyridoxamine 5'-phosphate oxidase superfamily)
MTRFYFQISLKVPAHKRTSIIIDHEFYQVAPSMIIITENTAETDLGHLFKTGYHLVLKKIENMFGKLNAVEIEAVIQQQPVGRIGCHADDLTYVVPISYAYDGTYIYARSFEGMKINMMRKNPSVCFQTDNTNDLSNWQSVILWGVFEELEGAERTQALRKLTERTLPIVSSETMHLTPQWPFMPEDTDHIEGIVFRIRVTEKSGRFEKIKDRNFFAT